jgi:hypothetical protein
MWEAPWARHMLREFRQQRHQRIRVNEQASDNARPVESDGRMNA